MSLPATPRPWARPKASALWLAGRPWLFVRVVMLSGVPWWVAADVCKVLEIANGRDAVSRLDAEDRNTVVIADGNRGNPNTTAINESGLYSLIFTSRKEAAKRFKRWVTRSRLAALRPGSYPPFNTGSWLNVGRRTGVPWGSPTPEAGSSTATEASS